ncbi:hypothetical protein Sjap_021923 [Stephania japonica]|uniref:Uncharacterized protein n=1 Tax=Stephania japonica TaxID=461633 RepID=A0AAP0EMV9_9MAGN
MTEYIFPDSETVQRRAPLVLVCSSSTSGGHKMLETCREFGPSRRLMLRSYQSRRTPLFEN